MIEVSATTAFMIYLCMTLCILFGIWGYQHYFTRKHKIDIAEQELFVCEYCQFCYLDDGIKPVTKCPQCHSFNKPDAKRKK